MDNPPAPPDELYAPPVVPLNWWDSLQLRWFQLLRGAAGYAGFTRLAIQHYLNVAFDPAVESLVIRPLLNQLNEATLGLVHRIVERVHQESGHAMSLATSSILEEPPYAAISTRLPFGEGLAPDKQMLLFASLAYEHKTIVEAVLLKDNVHYIKRDDTEGYLYRVPGSPTLVLAFRGTEPTNLADWYTDANYLSETVTGDGDIRGKVHRGFARAVNGVLLEIWRYIRKFGEDGTDSFDIYVCGHSLGAGLAAVASARLLDRPLDGEVAPSLKFKRVCSLAGPVIGDKDYTRSFERKFRDTFVHYVLRKDLIPRLHRWNPALLPPTESYEEYSRTYYIEGSQRGGYRLYLAQPRDEPTPHPIPSLSWPEIIVEAKRKLPRSVLIASGLLYGVPVTTGGLFEDLYRRLLPFYVFDHLPSEYLKALHSLEERERVE